MRLLRDSIVLSNNWWYNIMMIIIWVKIKMFLYAFIYLKNTTYVFILFIQYVSVFLMSKSLNISKYLHSQFFKCNSVCTSVNCMPLKQLFSRCSKNKKWMKILKLMLNTGQVMFSGEIYYYWPLNSVDKLLVKHRFSLHNLLRY